MPNGQEFAGLEKAAQVAKTAPSKVRTFFDKVKWDIESPHGDNPFNGIKTLVELNIKYKEIYSSFGPEITDDPKDEKARKLKNMKNEQIMALNMNYHLQRYLIAKNFVEEISQLKQEIMFAAQDKNTTEELLGYKQEFVALLKEVKIYKFYRSERFGTAKYMIDLCDYLIEVYTETMNSSKKKYIKLKKEVDNYMPEEKNSFVSALKSMMNIKPQAKPQVGQQPQAVKPQGAVTPTSKPQQVTPQAPTKQQANIPKPQTTAQPAPEIKVNAGDGNKVPDEKTNDNFLTQSKKIKVHVKK